MLQGWMPQSFVFRKKSEGEGGYIVLAMALGVAGDGADPGVAVWGVTETPKPPPGTT